MAEATPFEPFYGTRGHRGEGKARAFEPRSAILHALARTGTAAAVSAPSYVFEVQFFSDRADDDVAVCDALRRAYRHLWALWALGSDDLALCGLEDVGDAPAAAGRVSHHGVV